ncbi:hypothetical protein [Kribbella sp. NBC_00889]|uniref:hypothetical protein n=1 Tax=Kribbella sp. NBC_00889 TaxID=2975974 RepID=UPI003863AB5B|nr:hypothetical protein OG817_37985 [Kribbella sp. NBC_00889]
MTASVVAAPAGSLEELLARSGQVAVEVSGAGQTAWNGQVVETVGEVLGLAHWDGTLYVDSECILDPLRQMYAHAGEEQPLPVLVQYRESLATLLHEHAHFLGPAGATQEAARGAFTRPGSRQLEEGVAEAWAQDHLNEYLTRLGVDKVAPGIEDARGGGYYAAFVPAVRILAADLETRGGDLQPGEVLRALNQQTAEGQFPLLTSLVYNSTRLPDLDRSGTSTRNHLEAILRQGFAHLDTFELAPAGLAADRSRSTTTALLHHLTTEIHKAESHHTPTHELPPPTHLPPTPGPLKATPPTPQRLTFTPPATPHSTYRSAPSPLQTALAGISPPTPSATTQSATQTTISTRPPGVARCLQR